MTSLVQQLINGLAIGSVYALVAVGYTLVFGVLRFINFAHGSIATLGAYFGLFAVATLRLPIAGVFALALVLTGISSMGVERGAYRPLRLKGVPTLNILITSIGVSFLVENCIVVFVSADFHSFPAHILPSLPLSLGNVAKVAPVDILICAVAISLMTFLYLFLINTKTGVAIRAVAYDAPAAALMGININLTVGITFFLAGVMAAAAGVLLGMKFSVNPYLGGLFGLKSFAAAVVGGIGSVPGAYLGGYAVGLLETLGAAYVSSNFKDAIAFVLLVLILLFRPTGLLGRRIQEKV